MKSDFLTAELFDILLYEEQGKFTDIAKRSYSAISFRLGTEKCCFKCAGKTFYASNGDISYVPQNVEYKRSSNNESLIVFHFRESKALSNELIVFTPENSEKYKALFKKALILWNEKSPGYRYRATAVLYDILAELTSDGMQFGTDMDKDVTFAKDKIEQSFTNPDFRIEELAAQLYISETYLRRKFKKQLGVSPKQYLISRRIAEAKIMLESQYFSGKEISKRCGFSDVKYFRTAFKDQTGMTLKEYKSEKHKSI